MGPGGDGLCVRGGSPGRGIDSDALAGCLARQLGALAHCPGIAYDCKKMAVAHAGLGVSQLDFIDFMADFEAAFDAHAVTHPELVAGDKLTLVTALGDMVGDIVADPTSDMSLYQRVGRKPAIQGFVGAPGLASTFLDRVMSDPAINGFFAMTGMERLHTCLVRQLGALDGPIHYGFEVTAPDGIETGVSLGDPCGAMKGVHAGLVNGEMQDAAITIDDFLALLQHLADAMTSFAVPVADRDAILEVLGPLCHVIVADAGTCPGDPSITLTERTDLGLLIDNLKEHGGLDDKYNGTVASMLCVTLQVPATGFDVVADVRLEIGLTHSFIGDLTIKVVAPDGTLSTALSRPGPEPMPLADDGIACCGDDSNFLASVPFTLRDEALLSAQKMGKGIDNASVVCKDEQPKMDPCEFKTFSGGGPGNGFAEFKGTAADGPWRVCIGDSGKGDFGVWEAVGLTLTRTQAP